MQFESAELEACLDVAESIDYAEQSSILRSYAMELQQNIDNIKAFTTKLGKFDTSDLDIQLQTELESNTELQEIPVLNKLEMPQLANQNNELADLQARVKAKRESLFGKGYIGPIPRDVKTALKDTYSLKAEISELQQKLGSYV